MMDRDTIEAAAKVVEDLSQRTLAKQYPDADVMSFSDTINLYIRMSAVLLPEAAALIRALLDDDK
jgi:hypothetical protein